MKRTLVKRLAMRNIILLFTVIFVCAINLHGQDKFNAIQLTFDSAQEGFPTWSHDGKFIVYSYISSKDTFGNNGLWKISFDGKEAEQIFIGIAEHPKWSPDDRYIVFDADSGKSIKMIPAKGGTPISIIPDSIHIMNGGLPCWSPDGKRIAFNSTRSGNFDVWLMDLDIERVREELQALND